MFRSSLLAAAAATLLSSSVHAQCTGDPGLILDMTPNLVPLGTGFDVNITAPVGNLVVLLASASPGPTATPYGSLCVGLPAGSFAFIQPAPTITFPHPIECRSQFVGIKGYFQFLTVNLSQPSPVGKSNSETIEIINADCALPLTTPGDFTTFTQGGWGAKCNGGNPGCLRDQHFASVFPTGMRLGDQDGPDADNAFTLLLTSSNAVEVYIPAGGTAGAFNQDVTNASSTSAGVFGGQLCAAKLNVGFDAAGIFDGTKADPGVKLADLVYIANVHPKLIGHSVAEVILFSDLAISGAATMPLDVDGDTIGDVSFADLADALDELNNNFDNGNQSLGSLGLYHDAP